MGKAAETTNELGNFVTIRLDDDTAAEVNEITEKERRGTRSNTIRALIGEALDARKKASKR
jgi:metal-responsive CopG/Arc/MetJ family transcriptional regulator